MNIFHQFNVKIVFVMILNLKNFNCVPSIIWILISRKYILKGHQKQKHFRQHELLQIVCT